MRDDDWAHVPDRKVLVNEMERDSDSSGPLSDFVRESVIEIVIDLDCDAGKLVLFVNPSVLVCVGVWLVESVLLRYWPVRLGV